MIFQICMYLLAGYCVFLIALDGSSNIYDKRKIKNSAGWLIIVWPLIMIAAFMILLIDFMGPISKNLLIILVFIFAVMLMFG